MHTRATSDYTPTIKGSREENEAVHARKEMMKVFAGREAKPEVKRKTWRERMRLKACKYKHMPEFIDVTKFDSEYGIQRHKDRQAERKLSKSVIEAPAEETKPKAKKAAKPRKPKATAPKVVTKVTTKRSKKAAKED